MKNINAQVQHAMLAWLREPENIEKTEELNTALKEIGTIEGVSQVVYGQKITEFGGPDQGFNYGWTITFENAAAVKHYMKHPAHLRAAQVAMRLSEKVIGGFYEVE